MDWMFNTVQIPLGVVVLMLIAGRIADHAGRRLYMKRQERNFLRALVIQLPDFRVIQLMGASSTDKGALLKIERQLNAIAARYSPPDATDRKRELDVHPVRRGRLRYGRNSRPHR